MLRGGSADFSFDGAGTPDGVLASGVLSGGANAVAVPGDAGAGGSEGFGVDGLDVGDMGAGGPGGGTSLLPPMDVSIDSAVGEAGFVFASPGFNGVVRGFASVVAVPEAGLPLSFFESPDDIPHSLAPLTGG